MDTEGAILFCENNKIEGSYVECGVYEGLHPVMACNMILNNKLSIRDIYMYDTYEGLTKPGEYDYTTSDPIFHMNNNAVLDEWTNKKTGDNRSEWCCCSLEKVKENVNKTNYPEDKLHFIKGDVMETLLEESNLPEKISVLRLDTDWYESSKFELERLYDRVSFGGVIILDDYFHWDGQRRAVDEYLEEHHIQRKVIKIDSKTGYFIK